MYRLSHRQEAVRRQGEAKKRHGQAFRALAAKEPWQPCSLGTKAPLRVLIRGVRDLDVCFPKTVLGGELEGTRDGLSDSLRLCIWSPTRARQCCRCA